MPLGVRAEHGAVTDRATQERVPCQARTDCRWEAEALPGTPTPRHSSYEWSGLERSCPFRPQTLLATLPPTFLGP